MTDHDRFEIIYLDNHLLAVAKPAGMLVQGDSSGDVSLFESAKKYIKDKFAKPGDVYLALLHRIDRPVSGVVLLAKTSKAAARLNEQFREHQVRRIYWALVRGKSPQHGVWQDRLQRCGKRSKIVTQQGKEARLRFVRRKYKNNVSWLEIELETGRHHQIRVQSAYHDYPILGDVFYGSTDKFKSRTIALHARSLTVLHPTRKESLVFTADLPKYWPQWVGEEKN